MDLFVAPTIGFDLLYAFIIVRLARRDLVWINVTPHPTADWIARQITEAFPWNEAPRYLIRDRDRVYGAAVTHRLPAMGIRDKPIAPRLALAEWLRRKADRVDPTRVCRPRDRVGRGTPTKDFASLCTDHWTRTRPYRARFSGSDASRRMRYWAAFITAIAESSFRYTQPIYDTTAFGNINTGRSTQWTKTN
jgi:hypothetical protein